MSPTSYRTAPPRDGATVTIPRVSKAVKMHGLDLRALAKVQLHCHLEGTVRAETFRSLAAKHGVDLGERADPAQTYAFATFREFLLLFAKVTETLRAPEDYARIARDYVADAASQGVRYAEVFVAALVSTFTHRRPDPRAGGAAVSAALAAAVAEHGVGGGLSADVTRC